MSSSRSVGGVWSPGRRALTAGLVLAVTLVGFESLSVATVLPVVSRQLHGVRLYGWVFSAFFLGSLVGIVVAGRQADRIGLRRPFAVGLALFGGGLVVGGTAPAMGVLVAARAVQGFGAGAIPAAAYVAIGRGYPPELRSRMFAVLSTAWVAPGLIGPALAGSVADRFGWRWVFLGLVPLVVAAAVIAVPQVARIGRPVLSEHPAPAGTGGLEVAGLDVASAGVGDVAAGVAPAPAVLVDALRVAAGAGLALAGLTVASVLPTVALVAAGGAVGLPAFRRLVPPGTLRARRGLPLAVLTRGVLAFGFFGADAYVPLTLTSIRGASAAAAGVALTTSTITWTLGSWVQERRIERWGPRRLIFAGFGLVVLGIAGFATLLAHAVPVWLGPVMWAVSGLGIGMAYSPISVTVLHEAAPGREGAASASLQLTEVLGVALGTGLGGAVIALGHAHGWDPRQGLLIAFGLSGAAALAGLALACRLPVRLS